MTQPTPGLSAAQAENARFLYQRALSRGLTPGRAKEIAAAAYSESSLDPHAKNASGAAGDFQLLSQGYVDKANAAGGVFDPGANEDAILPDYQAYWRSHPGAAPGEAAAAVERSGEGAGFYTKGMGLLGFLAGGKPAAVAGTAAPAAAGVASPIGVDPMQQFRLQVAQAVGSHQHLTPRMVLGLVQQRLGAQNAASAAPGTPQTVTAAPTASAAPSRAMPTTSGKLTWTGASIAGEDPTFIRRTEQAAMQEGATAIDVISGERAGAHNQAVGGVAHSNHLPDANGFAHAVDARAYVPGKGWVPLGVLLAANAAKMGLRSGDQPGFYRGGPDVNHVDDGHNGGR